MELHDKFVFETLGKEIDETVLTSAVQYTAKVNSDNNVIKLGSACSCEVVFDCIDFDGNIRELHGEEFLYEKYHKGHYHKYGYFKCSRPSRNTDGTYTVTAYDRIYSMEQDAVDWILSISEPISLLDFVIQICYNSGLIFDVTDDFLNQNYMIPVESFDEFRTDRKKSCTYRKLLQYAAEAAGCYAFANENGHIQFGWYKENNDIVITPSEGAYTTGRFMDANGDYVVTSEFDATSNKSVIKSFIVAVTYSCGYMMSSMNYTDFVNDALIRFLGSDNNVLKTSGDEIFIVYPEYMNHVITGVGIEVYTEQSQEALYVYSENALTPEEEYEVNVYYIDGNILLQHSTDEALSVVADNIAERLSSVIYIPCSCAIFDTTKLSVGDIVKVHTDDNARFNMYVMETKASGGNMDLMCYGEDFLDQRDSY